MTREDFVKKSEEIMEKLVKAGDEFKELQNQWLEFDGRDNAPFCLIIAATGLTETKNQRRHIDIMAGTMRDFSLSISRQTEFCVILNKAVKIAGIMNGLNDLNN